MTFPRWCLTIMPRHASFVIVSRPEGTALIWSFFFSFLSLILPLRLKVSNTRPAPLWPPSSGLAARRGAGDGGCGLLYNIVLVSLALGVVLGFLLWSHVAYGEMPLASSSLVLLPSTGWSATMPAGELPRRRATVIVGWPKASSIIKEYLAFFGFGNVVL